MKAGYKNTEPEDDDENEVEDMMPVLTINADQLGDVKKWDIDKEYTLKVQVKMVGKHSANFMGQGKTTGEFKVTGVEAL